jgi:hypothetical protein
MVSLVLHRRGYGVQVNFPDKLASCKNFEQNGDGLDRQQLTNLPHQGGVSFSSLIIYYVHGLLKFDKKER